MFFKMEEAPLKQMSQGYTCCWLIVGLNLDFYELLKAQFEQIIHLPGLSESSVRERHRQPWTPLWWSPLFWFCIIDVELTFYTPQPQ